MVLGRSVYRECCIDAGVVGHISDIHLGGGCNIHNILGAFSMESVEPILRQVRESAENMGYPRLFGPSGLPGKIKLGEAKC